VSKENVTGTVTFLPMTTPVCQPAAIVIKFTTTLDIPTNATHMITAPGLTNTGCRFISNDTRAAARPVLLKTQGNFRVFFVRGSFLNTYVSSHFLLKSTMHLPAGSYQFSVDRANGLQRTCPTNSTWSVTRIEASPSRRAEIRGLLSFSHYLPGACFAYNSSLTFSPAQQTFEMSINLTLTLGFTLRTGDYITLYLPFFTNNKHANNIVSSPEISPLSLSYPTTYSTFPRGSSPSLYLFGNTTENSAPAWKGLWHEGSNSSAPGSRWSDPSRAVLYPSQVFPAGTPFSVIIDAYPNKLSSRCGQPANMKEFRVAVSSSQYFLNLSSVLYTQPIGDNCRSKSYCNGNGVCDFCSDRCKCFDGFGSASDKLSAVSDDFLPDCSSRACPSAPALWTNTLDFASVGSHRLMECSNTGICNRATGTCACFAGYEGGACEKMKCPGSPVCSGRGVCKTMTLLAMDVQALPLSHAAITAYDQADGLFNTNPRSVNVTRRPGTAPRDGNFGRACVCDSSWPVGLGVNQTQQAEFFGPACEFRRCPTGDNPETAVNELNCTGKALTGGSSLGSIGNLCHVDCSNQGICDFSIGESSFSPLLSFSLLSLSLTPLSSSSALSSQACASASRASTAPTVVRGPSSGAMRWAASCLSAPRRSTGWERTNNTPVKQPRNSMSDFFKPCIAML
jgi:hypothetical protein